MQKTHWGQAVLRAVNFGDLITADHKVLSDNCESRNSHRFAVVVQDLATQWIPACFLQKQDFTRNPEKLAKVLGTREETKSHLHSKNFWNSAKFVKIFLEIIARLGKPRSGLPAGKGAVRCSMSDVFWCGAEGTVVLVRPALQFCCAGVRDIAQSGVCVS